MVYGYELEVLLTKMKKEYDSVNDQILRLPRGRLMICKRGGGTEYFQEYYDKGRRVRVGISKKREVIYGLARKKYLEIKRDYLRQDISLLEGLLTNFIEPDHESIWKVLPARLKELPGRFYTEESTWAKQSYRQSDFTPEHRTHITSRGLRVRSKSELIIVEKLYEYDMDFRYEEILEFERVTVVPDFTIRRRDGKVFYWEHCGRTQDKKYMEHHRWKMNLYESKEIVLWDNLIVTYDDKDGHINIAAVEGEIKAKLLI